MLGKSVYVLVFLEENNMLDDEKECLIFTASNTDSGLKKTATIILALKLTFSPSCCVVKVLIGCKQSRCLCCRSSWRADLGSRFLRPLVWSVSGSDARVATHGSGITRCRTLWKRRCCPDEAEICRFKQKLPASIFCPPSPDETCLTSLFLTSQLLTGQILVGSVDCQRFQTLCQSQGVRAYPEIRLYLSNTRQPDHFMYVPQLKSFILWV